MQAQNWLYPKNQKFRPNNQGKAPANYPEIIDTLRKRKNPKQLGTWYRIFASAILYSCVMLLSFGAVGFSILIFQNLDDLSLIAKMLLFLVICIYGVYSISSKNLLHLIFYVPKGVEKDLQALLMLGRIIDGKI